jgi:Phage integrase family
VPVIPDDWLRKLLVTCKTKQFVDLRDQAIIRVLYDCGLRRAECAGLEMNSGVDLDCDVVNAVGKGSRPRSVPFGVKTGQAIERYLRARRRHKFAHLPHCRLASRAPAPALSLPSASWSRAGPPVASDKGTGPSTAIHLWGRPPQPAPTLDARLLPRSDPHARAGAPSRYAAGEPSPNATPAGTCRPVGHSRLDGPVPPRTERHPDPLRTRTGQAARGGPVRGRQLDPAPWPNACGQANLARNTRCSGVMSHPLRPAHALPRSWGRSNTIKANLSTSAHPSHLAIKVQRG